MENVRIKVKNPDEKPITIEDIEIKISQTDKEIEDIEAELEKHRQPLTELEEKIEAKRQEEEARAEGSLGYKTKYALKWLNYQATKRKRPHVNLPDEKISKKLDKIYGKELDIRTKEYNNLTKHLQDRLETLLSHKGSLASYRKEEEARQEEEELLKAKDLAEAQEERKEKLLVKLQRQEKAEIQRLKIEKFKATLKHQATHAISLKDWINARNKPNIYKLYRIAEKKIDQVVNQICEIHNLTLVKTKQLPPYRQRKYKKYRLTKYHRGYYLIPLKKIES
jgi:hypothetical protein